MSQSQSQSKSTLVCYSIGKNKEFTVPFSFDPHSAVVINGGLVVYGSVDEGDQSKRLRIWLVEANGQHDGGKFIGMVMLDGVIKAVFAKIGG